MSPLAQGHVVLAVPIGRSEGAVRKWLRGDAEPNATDLHLLSQATGATVEWLIFGGEAPLLVEDVIRARAYATHRLEAEFTQRPADSCREFEARAKRDSRLRAGALAPLPNAAHFVIRKAAR